MQLQDKDRKGRKEKKWPRTMAVNHGLQLQMKSEDLKVAENKKKFIM